MKEKASVSALVTIGILLVMMAVWGLYSCTVIR